MASPRNREHLSAERVRQVLDYDPDSGILRWRKLSLATKIRKVGDIAGSNDHGYIRIRVDGKTHYAHCLAWLWMTGAWPPVQIDHRNTIRNDNRWENLREATASLNMENRRRASKRTSSNLLGVTRRNRVRNPFSARIGVGRRVLCLGVFPTAEAAYGAYVRAKRQLHKGCTL